MSDVKIHIVAVAHGDINGHLALLVQVVDGLAEHEEQRTGVGAHATRRRDVEEFHLLLFVQPEVHTLYLVVHMGIDRTMSHLKPRFLISLFK